MSIEIAQSDWSNLGDRDDLDDVMETSLTIDYDKQWLTCVSAIGPVTLAGIVAST